MILRRLYVAPHGVWLQHIDFFCPRIGSHYVDLIAYTGDPTHYALKHSNNAAWLALPSVAAWVAAGMPILISTSLSHSEYSEEKWHSHPEVAILPHPTFEGTDKLSKHVGNVVKKLKQKHMDALNTVGVLDTHTVFDVADKAKAIHPLVKLSSTL